nr:MAG TPA: hypothetical protein [Caudoviricetes sp.]
MLKLLRASISEYQTKPKMKPTLPCLLRIFRFMIRSMTEVISCPQSWTRLPLLLTADETSRMRGSRMLLNVLILLSLQNRS